MAELTVLLHDDELDEKRHEVRTGGLSDIPEPSSPTRFHQMSSFVRSFASKIPSPVRLYEPNLSVDAVPAIRPLFRSLISIFFALLLSLRPRYMRKGGLKPTKKAHLTTYLDALRGWAAVIVLNSHHFPYKRAWIINQPFVRIIFGGRGMVDVFFVISGYVLSYRMLKLMRTQQAVPLLDTVVSSVFRR